MRLDPRALLFTPGDRADRFPRAARSGADALVFDLEDAVPVAAKDAARANLPAFIAGAGHTPVLVRVNQNGTPWLAADVQAAAEAGAAGVILPKCGTAAAVQRVAELLPVGMEVVPLIETARGVLAAAALAAAGPWVGGVAFGAYDYANDMSIPLSRGHEELDVPKALVGLAARAARVQAIDTAFADVHDTEALVAEALRAKRLGFSGKLCIHPDQVEPVQRVFSPAPEEIAYARRVVDAFRGAAAEAAVALDGKLIDYPIAEQQERLLERARSLGLDRGEAPGGAGGGGDDA
jgi:citrate lyase subunit beta / citryl-CoA lyase